MAEKNQLAQIASQLPQGTEGCLCYIARMLAGRFTGRIEISCNQGGIRSFAATEQMDPQNLPNLTYPPTSQ